MGHIPAKDNCMQQQGCATRQAQPLEHCEGFRTWPCASFTTVAPLHPHLHANPQPPPLPLTLTQQVTVTQRRLAARHRLPARTPASADTPHAAPGPSLSSFPPAPAPGVQSSLYFRATDLAVRWMRGVTERELLWQHTAGGGA